MQASPYTHLAHFISSHRRRHTLFFPPSTHLPVPSPRPSPRRTRNNSTRWLRSSTRRRKKRSRQTRKSQHPTHNHKMYNPYPFPPRNILLLNRRPSSLNPPLSPPRILRTLRPEMSPRVKMPQRVPINKPRRIFGVIPSAFRLPCTSTRKR